MSSTVPYIGSKISLVSNSDVRYEGTLHNINTQDSTIALESVRCFGTEGRKMPEIPAGSEIYDFIIFLGQGIKDLTVLEAAPALSAQLNDPAIMSVNQRPAGAAAEGKSSSGGPGGKGASSTRASNTGYGGGKGSSSGGGYGNGKGSGSKSNSGGNWSGGWREQERELLKQLEASRQELAAARMEQEVRAQREQELLEQLQASRQELAAARKELSWAVAASLPLPSIYAEYELQPIAPGDAIHGWLAEIFLGSCTRHRRDLHSSAFCDAPRLRLERVEVVVNPRLLKAYSNKAEEIQGLRRAHCGSIPTLAHLKVPPRKGAAPNWPDLNEHFLFHGATEDVLAEISRGGFDPRRGGEAAGRMFGTATYLAANASKADIYTEDFARRLPKQALRKVLVARALLGESHRTAETTRRATRPPNDSDGHPLDSVWADTRENGGVVDHLEVMVYDKGQAYPEFLVTYTHLPECRCAECGKRPAV